MTRRIIISLFSFAIILHAMAQKTELLNRPFQEFTKGAFVKYQDYHPSQFLTDNNWQILYAFTEPGKINKLDSLGISYNKSQLQLLQVGGLLKCYKDSAQTLMPILNREQTDLLRLQSKTLADSIYPSLKPRFVKLTKLFKKQGYTAQTYSLIFSWLLDGIVWNGDKLPSYSQMPEHPTWRGVYWATFSKNPLAILGTNKYGPIAINWSDDLGYWANDKLMINIADHIKAHPDSLYLPATLTNRALKWGICDDKGKIIIPVMTMNETSPINTIADEITTELCAEVNKKAAAVAPQLHILNPNEAAVIFYHEIMWYIFSKLESDKVVQMPAILKGEEVGSEHLRDITFICLD